jgi:hypothetical protein
MLLLRSSCRVSGVSDPYTSSRTRAGWNLDLTRRGGHVGSLSILGVTGTPHTPYRRRQRRGCGSLDIRFC